MPWTYVQKTGDLYLDGHWVARGYSGHGTCRNMPDAQSFVDMGPIPRGVWRIEGPPAATETHGPFVLRLEPEAGTETFSRTGFLMHGDSMANPGTCSRGCIVMAREVRETVWGTGDRRLEVVAEPPEKEKHP